MYVLDFDQTTIEYAQWSLAMPSDYNGGVVTAAFYWTATTGTGVVNWAIQGYSYGDDDALDATFGTAILVADTLITANDVHISAATANITLGGTPAASEFVQFQVYRDTGATDTLAGDARLLGVRITFTRA